jgi:lipopolysaccharide/colanic/teichoic acid biosynthesis glycosyltransferase
MTRRIYSRTGADLVERLVDGSLAAILLMLTAPLAMLVAVAIKVDSSGPVLFRATRVGINGRLFTMLKFRTMRTGPADWCGITMWDDPRITRFGRWLRATKLDEWPQLVNVIKGDMSLVGPRPEDPRYVALYTAEQRQLLCVRPGITSVASLAFRDEASLLAGPDGERRYCEEILPKKLAMELASLDRSSPVGNLRVLCWTAAACFFSRGTTPGGGNTRSHMPREGPPH